MKQKKSTMFYSHIWGKIFALLFLWLPASINAELVTSNITVDGIQLTITYNNVVCLGSQNVITYTLENTNTTPYANNITLAGFTPDGTQPQSDGLAFVSAVPPQPSGVISFDPTAPFTPCGVCDNCPAPGSAAPGLGLWVASSAAQPLANGIPYQFTITYEATFCGIQAFVGQLQTGGGSIFPNCLANCSCFDTISILVVPYASLSDVTVTAPVCNNNPSGVTGILPAPLCPSGCTGPLVDCSLVSCVGCTGATGPFPLHFTVSPVIGGTVSLVDQTGGVFNFTPDPSFSGTGIFNYNVVSDTIPQQFCSATAPGEVFLTVVQSPITSIATFTGCSNTGFTGNLSDFVTGGSLNYTFAPQGVPTCGSVTIPPNGIFTYTAPTGPAFCSFNYLVTDSVFGCTGSGLVNVTVLAPAIGDDNLINTCINQPVSDTLTATGGNPPFTFAISTPPANGIISAFDPTTGDFTYTPNLNFTGIDSFEFTVTDNAGCVSEPATITISVNPLPITSSTSIIGCQATQLTGSLTGLVTGGTGPQLFSVSGPNVQPCGVLQIFADGTFQFNPNQFFVGTCDFAFQVTQGGCPGTGPDTITFTIEPAPIATGATFNVCEFGNVTGDLNDLLISSTGNTSFTAVGGPVNGTLSLNPSGPFSFTATIASGVGGFQFQAISDLLTCPSDTETVTVIVHENPEVTTGVRQACSETTTNGNLNPLVDGTPPFTFTGPFTSTNGTTTITQNGLFTFTPDPGVTGGSFTFGVSDAFGCTAVGQQDIIVNPSPTAINQVGTGCSNSQATGSLINAVTGGTPGYIFSLVPPPVNGNATVSSTGNYIFTPTPGATAGSFVFRATDTHGCSATGNVDITINQAPTTTTGFFTGCSNGFTGSLLSLVTGPNPPFIFTGPIGAVINGTAVVDPSGDFSFTPSITDGQGRFNFQVTDSSVPPCSSNVTPVIIDIEPGPQALLATFDACEDVPLFVPAASGLANFVTGGVPPFTFFQTGPTPVCAAALTVNPDGSINFTPALDFTGPCSFLWQVRDSIPCDSNVSTGTIEVHPTPFADSPVFGACQLLPFTGDLNNFMSIGTPPYTFTGGNPVNGTIDFLLATGPFSFTPILVGLASFDYSAIDSFGCQSNTGTVFFDVEESPIITSPSPLDVCQLSSVTSTATATGSLALQPFTFSITNTVNGTAVIDSVIGNVATFTFTPDVMDFPTPTVIGSVTIRATAAPPSVCFDEVTVEINIHQNPIINITGIGSCTGNFTGSLAPFVTGGIPPYAFGPLFPPTNPPGCATVILDVFGDFSFSSTPGSTGPCSFDFNVTESSVSQCTTTGTVTVNISEPPFAQDVNVCQCANVPLALDLRNFVIGGTPPFTFSIIGVPIGGTVLLLNPTTGLVVFIPFPGFTGFASFQFQVVDSNNPPCISNIGTVTIQIPCCPTGATGIIQ